MKREKYKKIRVKNVQNSSVPIMAHFKTGIYKNSSSLYKLSLPIPNKIPILWGVLALQRSKTQFGYKKRERKKKDFYLPIG